MSSLRRRSPIVEGYGQLEMDPVMKQGLTKDFDDPKMDKEVEALKPLVKGMLNFLNTKTKFKGWRTSGAHKVGTIEYMETMCAGVDFECKDPSYGEHEWWRLTVFSPVGLDSAKVIQKTPGMHGRSATISYGLKKDDLKKPEVLFRHANIFPNKGGGRY